MRLLLLNLIFLVGFLSCNSDGGKNNYALIPLAQFNDPSEAFIKAKKNNLPVLVYYTAYADVNSRKAEDNVWTDTMINRLMSSYVVLELYIDDKKTLPDSLQYIGQNGKRVENVGQRYADIMLKETQDFKEPAFVVYDNNGNILSYSSFFLFPPDENSAPSFADFLLKGQKQFKEHSGKPGLLQNLLSEVSGMHAVCGGTSSTPAFTDTSTFEEKLSGSSSKNILQWNVSAKRISNDQAMLTITISIAKNYCLYAFNQESAEASNSNLEIEAPNSTLEITNLTGSELIGKPVETGVKSKYIDALACKTNYFEGKAIVTQLIKLKGNSPNSIQGSFNFMYGDDKVMMIDNPDFAVIVK
jgi:hypothetical protein